MRSTGDFAAFETAMRDKGQPELAIEVFRHHYEELVAGATGLVAESSIAPVASLPDVAALDEHRARGMDELSRLVVIKLNGGLGTTMGMERAKSLLPAKDGRSFLDLIAEQIVHLRRVHGVGLPLVLMDSFRTQADSLAALERQPELEQALPLSFLQHQVPKVLAEDLSPALSAAAALGDPELAWCPPGHGDLYPALHTSGLLDRLLAAGYRWAFVSNSDNLGATPDDTALAILGWMAAQELPFVMECADRTASDRKGGHLAMDMGGHLMLREVAQCPPEDADAFQDIARHRYFNTNNLWVDLAAVARLLAARGGRLGLPLIRNTKPLDPTVPTSPRVHQLETAMGAAIGLFAGAAAVRVPRGRFVPVKTTNDLLVLWSDAFERTADGLVRATVSTLPIVDLDPRYYKNIDDFVARVAAAPSLAQASRLTVRGDVRFGSGVVVRGEIVVDHSDKAPLALHDRVLLK